MFRLAQVFGGWVATLFVAGFVAAFFTAIGVFSPNKVASNDNVTITNLLNVDNLRMIRQMNGTATAGAGNAALGAQLTVRFDASALLLSLQALSLLEALKRFCMCTT